MQSALHLAHLAVLEGAILALLRESADQHDQHDGLQITATVHGAETSIEITYMVGAMPVSGESL